MKPTSQKVKTANRRVKVAEMYLTGKSQTEIAVHFGINQSSISRDIKAIQKAWLNQAVSSFDVMQSRELARIDQLEREYWDAWERSCQSLETTAVVKGRMNDGKMIGDEATKTIKTQAGDPRFLNGIQWCIEQRLKIFGGYAVVKHEVESINPRTPDLSIYNFEQLYELKHGHKPNLEYDDAP